MAQKKTTKKAASTKKAANKRGSVLALGIVAFIFSICSSIIGLILAIIGKCNVMEFKKRDGVAPRGTGFVVAALIISIAQIVMGITVVAMMMVMHPKGMGDKRMMSFRKGGIEICIRKKCTLHSWKKDSKRVKDEADKIEDEVEDFYNNLEDDLTDYEEGV